MPLHDNIITLYSVLFFWKSASSRLWISPPFQIHVHTQRTWIVFAHPYENGKAMEIWYHPVQGVGYATIHDKKK